MRKPLRDARARALRALARNATALRQEAAGWDYEERLVGADGAVPSSASRQAVEEFQAALADLGAAAAAQDLARTRMAYARTRSAYERVHALTTPAPAPTQ
jgi:iron uptake system EfeUOB component EfeO/EfeM